VALAAVPSGLLIAVTAHVSTDVAASPFLWVVPLALYLATFVIAFSRRALLRHEWVVRVEPLFVAGLVGVLAFGVTEPIFVTMAVNVVAFFVMALVCHGELARRRPGVRDLTAYYLWLSVGGVLGGISAALVAPRVFSWVAEYPLLIVLAVLCRPGLALPRGRGEVALWGAGLALAVALLLPRYLYQLELDETHYRWAIATLIAIAVLLSAFPLPMAAVVLYTFIFSGVYGVEAGRREFVRSFFGVHKIMESPDGAFRVLMHGTTEHGAQRIRDAAGVPLTGRPEPLTYYHAESPLAEGIAAVRERKRGPIRLAVIGLGTGTLACHTEPGDTLHYYEIDPAVVRIASDPRYFTYLSSCAPDAKIILGDARLTLADAEDGAYDLIIVDAFSSDAIPTHLLTKEAMAIYLGKLAPHGMVMMHVSNRYMELASVVAGIAHANGLVARTNESDRGEDEENHKFSSTVVAVAREEADFGRLAQSDDWVEEEPDEEQRVWTDDYSNIIGAMLRQLRR
jgi:hypothetical protein